ncbi:hypothetical protein Taro_004793 [Colocasia esculenta]|uniref:Uncharacterized protein n=1 Tax=Colocasia esculenta TaxID=4460 RepID=A0A843TNB1_COLES|nr:hypothetical protein [Colocasia esculenta]
MAMLTRQFKKFLKFKRRGSGNSKPFQKGTNRFDTSNKKSDVVCYEYKKQGHMRGECPELKKKLKKDKFVFKKAKAMLRTWSDEDDDEKSQATSGDDKIHYLMARSDDSSESFPISLKLVKQHILPQLEVVQPAHDLSHKIQGSTRIAGMKCNRGARELSTDLVFQTPGVQVKNHPKIGRVDCTLKSVCREIHYRPVEARTSMRVTGSFPISLKLVKQHILPQLEVVQPAHDLSHKIQGSTRIAGMKCNRGQIKDFFLKLHMSFLLCVGICL